ncbi:hypothetical protein C8T65DRAFT_835621 [Cerioporus squamosus]|nr:hypothetical protein C8T65DRAFT_835621 [Cerioporus squamosus]
MCAESRLEPTTRARPTPTQGHTQGSQAAAASIAIPMPAVRPCGRTAKPAFIVRCVRVPHLHRAMVAFVITIAPTGQALRLSGPAPVVVLPEPHVSDWGEQLSPPRLPSPIVQGCASHRPWIVDRSLAIPLDAQQLALASLALFLRTLTTEVTVAIVPIDADAPRSASPWQSSGEAFPNTYIP